MDEWMTQRVTLSFALSDLTLWRAGLLMATRRHLLGDGTQAVADPAPPADKPRPHTSGYMLRELPVSEELPVLHRVGDYVRYVTQQYRHCFIDMSGDFEGYRQKFSGKTRSTILRKVKRFTEHCGGELRWVGYSTPAELERFYPMALALSARTYQDRLLDAGLPSDPAFLATMRERAARDEVRAFLLFDGDRPVSYLFCPVDDGVLVYAYLGYDPEYQKLSVGTVLQWLALERLFDEGRFRYFDFTEGESEHKRLFATHTQACANVMFVRASWRALLLVHLHRRFVLFGEGLGRLLQRWGLKSAVRRWLRSGTQAAPRNAG